MESKTDFDYQKLVAEAEKAVAVLKDPELRRAAFDKILSHLLEQTSGEHGQKQKSPKGEVSHASKKAKVGTGPRGQIDQLIEEGFFKQQRTLPQVKAELANRGHHLPQNLLSGPLQKLCQARRLRRERVTTDGGKTVYGYSNW